jgi:hypothetical protein
LLILSGEYEVQVNLDGNPIKKEKAKAKPTLDASKSSLAKLDTSPIVGEKSEVNLIIIKLNSDISLSF